MSTPRDGCHRKIDTSQDHDPRWDSTTHRNSNLSLFLSQPCSLPSSLRPSELMSLFEEYLTSLVPLAASIIESLPCDSTVTSSDIHQLRCAHSFIFMTWLNRPFSPVVKIGSCFPKEQTFDWSNCNKTEVVEGIHGGCFTVMVICFMLFKPSILSMVGCVQVNSQMGYQVTDYT